MEIYMIEWEDSIHWNEINSAILICENIKEAKRQALQLSERKQTITHIGTSNGNAMGFVVAAYNVESIGI